MKPKQEFTCFIAQCMPEDAQPHLLHITARDDGAVIAKHSSTNVKLAEIPETLNARQMKKRIKARG
jgi:hypothetical protein